MPARRKVVFTSSSDGDDGSNTQTLPLPSRKKTKNSARKSTRNNTRKSPVPSTSQAQSPLTGSKRRRQADTSSDSGSDFNPAHDENEVDDSPVKRKNTTAVTKTSKIIHKELPPSNSLEPILHSPKKSTSLKNLVNKCVRYILLSDQKKHTIKKNDIIKHVFKDEDNKLFKKVISNSNVIFQNIFGFELLLVQPKQDHYILINILQSDIQEFVELTPKEEFCRGLIFHILTLIFMKNNSITEDELWLSLEPLGLDVKSKIEHQFIGDVRKYVTVELVKQMYLEYNLVSKDPPEHNFSWGQRAHQEVNKKDILKSSCKDLGNCEPRDWSAQFKDAYVNENDSDEGERSQ